MGSHPKQQAQGASRQAQGTSQPAAGPPAGWTPAQVQAGGRWETPKAPPGEHQGTGQNWVTPPPPVAPASTEGRDGLAHMIAMAASNNGNYYPQRDQWTGVGGGGAWMNGGR